MCVHTHKEFVFGFIVKLFGEGHGSEAKKEKEKKIKKERSKNTVLKIKK